MIAQNERPMPPEYGYLNAPLFRAQEHVFVINAEIEKLEGNAVNEQQLVKLQQEKATVIENLKREFELQTFEEGPEASAEVEAIVDTYLGEDAYQLLKYDLSTSGKTYQTSRYWDDKLERNIAERHDKYGVNEYSVDSFTPVYDIPDIYDDMEQDDIDQDDY